MALDIPPPRQFLTHAHWTMGREKMSKSTGNVVNPFFAIDRFGVDALRYFLVHNGGLKDDSPYDNSYIIEMYKKALDGGLGNLASRVLRGKQWNVRKSVILNKLPEDESAQKHVAALEKLPAYIDKYMTEPDPRSALQIISTLIYRVSQVARFGKGC
jgi:methionyl-tRNA synthetase